jgi:D-alanyl-D-alanine dipeptidase
LVEKVLARELTTAQVVEVVQAVEKGQDVERAVTSLLSPPVAALAAVELHSASEKPAVARRAAVSAEEKLLDPRPILRAIRDQLRQVDAEHLDTLEPRRGWGIRKLLEEIIAEATALRDRLSRPD